ncbi:unnamed protein product [Durusdinium trenchii]|uniref:Rhodanese domain-containing protein n=1 Tax=Durusdinium trenchii TaxID=1381693 RepID=A0ABP0RLF5_9DINO
MTIAEHCLLQRFACSLRDNYVQLTSCPRDVQFAWLLIHKGEAYGVPCVPSGSSYHLVTSHVLGPRGMVFDSEAWLEDVQQKIPDKEAKIVIGCAAGVRSKAAARVLEAAGYLNVQELDDGFNGWAARNRSCRSGLHATKPLTEDLKLLDAEPFHF